MKKTVITILAVLTLGVCVLAGCGNNEAKKGAATSVPKTEAGENENVVGMANPWVDITEDEAKQLSPRMFKAPEGAGDLLWQKCESLGDPQKNLGPLVQLKFTLDGNDFTARAQYGAAEDADISGIYATFAAGPDDVTLANWGGGNMQGKTYRAIDEEGYTDLITWYDIEIGIKYSLSVTAADLDGFDIQAVAEQMYDPGNEEAIP